MFFDKFFYFVRSLSFYHPKSKGEYLLNKERVLTAMTLRAYTINSYEMNIDIEVLF